MVLQNQANVRAFITSSGTAIFNAGTTAKRTSFDHSYPNHLKGTNRRELYGVVLNDTIQYICQAMIAREVWRWGHGGALHASSHPFYGKP